MSLACRPSYALSNDGGVEGAVEQGESVGVLDASLESIFPIVQ